MKGKRLIDLVTVAALIIVLLGFSQPVQAKVGDPPDHPGPYTVGFTFKLLIDTERTTPNTPEGGRPVPCYIWYPAEPENGEPMPTAIYPYDVLGLLGRPPDTSASYEQYGVDPAYQEITPSSDGPFPLLVFSTGLTTPAEMYYQFGARLASYGFVVVIMPNYGDGNLGEPQVEGEYTFYAWTGIDRILDIKFTITQLLEINEDPDSLLYHLIQPDQIAVSGHSWGGYAAMIAVGGDDLICDNEVGYPPESCFSIAPDPRIKAIVTLDGSGWVLRYQELARITVPNMIIGQEWDTLNMQDPGLTSWHAREHAAIQGKPNYRVDISEAYHMAFSNACGALFRNYDIGWFPWEAVEALSEFFCYSTPEHALEIQNITTMYMVAFLKANLVGDHSYQYILTPGYALTEQPLVEFFVTEKRNGVEVTEEWPDYFFYFMHQPADEHAKALKDPPWPMMEPDSQFLIR